MCPRQDCTADSVDLCVQIGDYDDIFDDIRRLVEIEGWSKILLGKPQAYSPGATFGIYRLIPEELVDFQLSPVMLMKAQKNEVSVVVVVYV